jgi:hypothetical protein
MIKEFLLKVINIKIVNFILIVYLFTALFSHFKIIFETEKITKQLLESKDMPEWKSKFLKEKARLNGNIISSEKGRFYGFIDGSVFGIGLAINRKKKKAS